METGAQMSAKTNPLSYLTQTLDDLRAKGTAPRLRILEGEHYGKTALVPLQSLTEPS